MTDAECGFLRDNDEPAPCVAQRGARRSEHTLTACI